MGKSLKIFLGEAVLALAVLGLYRLSRPGISEQAPSIVPGVGTGLIEYSDFQCPACGVYYPIIKALQQEFGESIVFVYRNFPLRQIHANADLAARSAEAAGKQGKFWEMHDMIFENQKDWASQSNAKKSMIEYAQSLNLDAERFKTDLDSKEVKEKVNNDYLSGIQAKVNAVPTFFLNGTKLQNPESYEEFKKLLEEAILKV